MKVKCGENDFCFIRTSGESHPSLQVKDHFQKTPIFFWIIADFEADNEIDNSSRGKRKTNNYKQNPICNGYYIISELEEVLENGYFKSPSGYDNVDWFLEETIKMEIKRTFNFKNTKEDINMTQEDEKRSRKTDICRFCNKKV